MATDEQLKYLYDEAYKFLESKIGKEVLEQKLKYQRYYKAETMIDVYWHMLQSLCNKRGMPASIGPIDVLESFYFDFDPLKTHEQYGDDWKKLFKIIKKNYTPPGPMDISKPNSYWAIFCRGSLSGAAFLAKFESFDMFDKFVGSFTFNHLSIAALALLIEHEIYGMGFPLAGDWLKGCGYSNYGKSDVHTQGILYDAGMLEKNDSFECFKLMARIGKLVGQPVAIVDKLLWWIGSGKYVNDGEKVTRHRKEFIEILKQRI
ncbi:hypothetical protein ACFLZM_07180 [Thermodesulfobacteriota bacterium]